MEGIFLTLKEIGDKIANLRERFLTYFDDYLADFPQDEFTKAYNWLESLNKDKDFDNNHYRVLLLTLGLLKEPVSGSQLRFILVSNNIITASPYNKLTATIEEDNNQLIIKAKLERSRSSTFALTSLARETVLNLASKANLDVEGAFVRVSSYRSLPAKSPYFLSFDLDYSDQYKENKLLKGEDWRGMTADIKTIRNLIPANQTLITIDPYKPHQCLGFLLGHILGNFRLRTHQINNYKEKKRELWQYKPSENRPHFHSHWEVKKSVHFADEDLRSVAEVALIINVSRVISAIAKNYLDANYPQLPYFDLYIASGVRNTCFQNMVDASQKIDAVEQFLNDLSKEFPLKALHIFWNAPFSFAVMLGQKLRKGWKCILYQWSKASKEFYFATEIG